MNFEVRIQNIGKLVDATVSVGDFTVFAGPNNTGKSFVSKLLYSFFDAMKTNHVETYITRLIAQINWPQSMTLLGSASNDGTELSTQLDMSLEHLQTSAKNVQIENLDKTAKNLIVGLERVRAILSSSSINFTTPMSPDVEDVIKKRLPEAITVLKNVDAGEIVSVAINSQIRRHFEHNFQIPNHFYLRATSERPASVHVEKFGRFDFEEYRFFFDKEIDFKNRSSSLSRLRRYGNIIYLESPVYWKLKNALESVLLTTNRSLGKRERLTGVPGYFYDLARELTFGYLGNMAFPDVHRRLTSPEIIGGRVTLTEGGSLNFHEDERIHPLSVTATGVANLGILALLIERRVLNENSLIFIDEPEAHLHPAWQAVMAEALFELARQGARVVIATHSMDILKWLEVHVKKHPEHEELIALNRFPTDDNDPDEDFEIKMAKIMEDLTKPFSDLYLEGL